MSTEKMIYAWHAVCLLLACCLLQSCILVSDAKYQSDMAMWQAKAEASKAWAASANKPLATMTAASGEVFTVYNPNQLAPMPVVGEPYAIVQGADVVLNSWLAKMFGGGYLADKVLGNMQGNYAVSGSGSIDVSKESGNIATVTTRHTEGDASSIAEEQHIGSDTVDTVTTTDNRTDYDNATATPTVVDPVIVTQPSPIIVPTTVVHPEVVIVPSEPDI